MIHVFIPDFNFQNCSLIEAFDWTAEQGIYIAPIAQRYFSIVENPEQADWVVIPAFTTQLLHPRGEKLLTSAVELAKRIQKPLALFSNSDFILSPSNANAFVFTPGAYKSNPFQIDIPATFDQDPFEKWNFGHWEPAPHSQKPSIGFCGQATRNPLKALKDAMTFSKARLRKQLGYSHSDSGPIFLPAWERARLLEVFEKDGRFQTDFVLRTKYKGGATSEEQKRQVEREFFENIYSNLFTVCMRGMGNYSVRFYQTLAMGRIPVLIDTDYSVAFNAFHQLESLIPVIPYAQKNHAAEMTFEYFAGKNAEELIHIQKQCRLIWEAYFQKEGLIKYLAKSMEAIQSSNKCLK